MRSQIRYSSFAVAAAIVATMSLHGWTPIWAQDPVPAVVVETSISSASKPTPTLNRPTQDRYQTSNEMTPIRLHMKSDDHQIKNAVKTLQTATTDAEKEKARQGISTALSDYFDTDMKKREQDIADIEARVTKLRTQLEKRREAKAKLVDLQLKVLVNEAQGLGFYSQPGSQRQRYPSGIRGRSLDGPSQGVIAVPTR